MPITVSLNYLGQIILVYTVIVLKLRTLHVNPYQKGSITNSADPDQTASEEAV